MPGSRAQSVGGTMAQEIRSILLRPPTALLISIEIDQEMDLGHFFIVARFPTWTYLALDLYEGTSLIGYFGTV